jgi:hypothetical protein
MTVEGLIVEERRRLQRVHAILTCAIWAANHDVEADYADVMATVAEIIAVSIAALDSAIDSSPPTAAR